MGLGCAVRLTLIIIVVLMALPFISKGIEFFKEKSGVAEKAVKEIIENIN